MVQGPVNNCDWIGFKRDKLFHNRKEYQKSQEEFSVAFLGHFEGIPEKFIWSIPKIDADLTSFTESGISFPYGWTPDNAIYTSDSNPDKSDLEEVSRSNDLITLRRKSTGELIYKGLPRIMNSKKSEESNLSNLIEEANALYYGLNIEKDAGKTFKKFKYIMELGKSKRGEAIYPDLFNDYVYCNYDEGSKGKKDYELAAKLYDLAVQSGSINALNNLGFLYLNGTGCNQEC